MPDSNSPIVPPVNPNITPDLGTPPPPNIVIDDTVAPADDTTKVVPPVDPVVIPTSTPDAVVPEPTSPTEVEIEGVTYTLDVAGNAVLNGNIVYTADQLEEQGGGEDYITLIEQNTGLQVLDETGNPIQFENSVEGLVAREKAIVEKVKNETRNSVLNELTSRNPEITQILNYKKLHGTLEGFKLNTDYSTVSFIEGDKDNHKQLISEELRVKGLSQKDIDITLKGLEIDNSLSDRAKESEAYLLTVTNERNRRMQQEIADRERIQTEQIEKVYGVTFENKKVKPLNIEGSIYDLIVTKGKINDFEIPTSGIVVTRNGRKEVFTREAIFNYIAIATPNGYSQAQIDDAQYIENNANKISRYLKNLLGQPSSTSQPVKLIKKVKGVPNNITNSNKVSGQDKIIFNFKTN